MKTIDSLGFTELTHAESIEIEGGILPLIPVLGLVFGGIGTTVTVFMLGYTVGKAIF